MPNEPLNRNVTRLMIELLCRAGHSAEADRYRGLENLTMQQQHDIMVLLHRSWPKAPAPEFSEEEVAEMIFAPAAPLLRRMASTYSERRGQYGASEQRFATAMVALFPNGLHLQTHTDWVRYGIFHQIIAKITRYVKDWNAPNIDTIHDIGPYSAMLEAEDRRHYGAPPFHLKQNPHDQR
jgi:hypothetical protein